METGRANRNLIILVLVLLGTLMLYPFKMIVVPLQRVLVVTTDMHPVRDALVRQHWQNYSLEREGHEEDITTDSHGRVTFPVRTIRASFLWRIVGPIASIARQGVHASFGVDTHMITLTNDGSEASSEIVQPQPGEIVYRITL